MGQLTWADVRRDWAKPPNLVTYARIGLLPVIWWLILMPELLGWLGWCILLVAVLTDKVDGWLAIGASLTSGWVYVAEWRAAVRQA